MREVKPGEIVRIDKEGYVLYNSKNMPKFVYARGGARVEKPSYGAVIGTQILYMYAFILYIKILLLISHS